MNHSGLDIIIETLRSEMVASGFAEGLTAARTVQLSQTLDYYLNLKMSLDNLIDTDPASDYTIVTKAI